MTRTNVDDDQRWREERAEQRRGRDRHREPRKFRPTRRVLVGRDAIKVALMEGTNGAEVVVAPPADPQAPRPRRPRARGGTRRHE